MRYASGVTDQYLYFVAVDATDLKTRETGLSSFTVYRSRNGGAAAAYTTPTINETDSTNMPGVYELLLDEDMTIDSGDETQEVCLHITHAGMAPVTRVFELYRPKITAGNTLDVTATGAAGVDWGNVENPTTVVGLSGTTVKTATDVETDTADIQSRLPAALTANGNIKASLVEILTTALTETAGLLAGGFKKFFNVASPSGTLNSLPDAVPGAAGGVFIAGTNAATTVTTALTTTFTGNLTGSVASVTGAVGSVTGAVGSVTGNVGGNVVGSVASVTAGVTLAASAVQAIWDALTSALTTAGSIGKLLVDNINATISSRLASASISLSGGAVTVGTNNDKTGYRLSATGVDDVLDEVVEGSVTLRQSMRLANAANAGKASGMGTTSVTIRDLSDSLNRISATVDADGNRTAVTLDLS